jgi:pimeloyl-ACP methyl ester carboxylesterase
VLLRGLSRSREHWGAFLERFRAAFPGGPVETPDLPGAGVHHAVSSPAQVAGLLAAVRAEVGPGPLWLLGLSLGGMVAQQWMRAHPREVAGAVLVNTSAGGLVPPWRRMRASAFGQVLASAATADPLARERRIHALTSNCPEHTEVMAAAWAALARRQPVSRANVARQLLAAARYRVDGGSGELPIPTLVLTSQQDRLVDPACSRALATHLHATLHEHPGAGHDLPLDDPDWVVEQVRGWLPAHAR